MPSVHSLTGLMKWLRREPWGDAFEDVLVSHLGPACYTAGIEIDQLTEIIDEDWESMLWGCAFEDFMTRDIEAGGNIVDDYLKRRGWHEKAPNKAYMQGLRNSVMSLYEVSDVKPGTSFLARDLVRGGEPIRITERSATRSLKPWDCIAGRVVELRGKAVVGGGLLPFSHESAEIFLASLRDIRKRPVKHGVELLKEIHRGTDPAEIKAALGSGEVLRYAAPLISTYWLNDLLEKLLNPRLPELRNSDGEELEFISLHYRLLPGVTAARVRTVLDRLPELNRDMANFWNWMEPQSVPSKPSDPEVQSGIRLMSTTLDGSTILGTLELKGRILELSVNSESRAERGRALLSPALEGLTAASLTERQTVEQVMTARRAEGEVDSTPGIPPAEQRPIVHAMMDSHYQEQLNERIPALGNISPRRAAKSTKGRKKLVAWLKALENDLSGRGSSDPMADYDTAWLWEELNITDLRR